MVKSFTGTILVAAALLLADAMPAHAAEGAYAEWPRVAYLAVMLVIFLGLRAFYAGSETALVSLNKPRIQRLARDGNKRARTVENLVASPTQMLGMTLVGTNLMSVFIAQVNLLLVWALLGLSTRVYETVVGDLHLDPTMIATVSTTFLVLIFGEIIPKTLFRVKANQMALRYAFPLRVSELVLNLGVRLVTFMTTVFIKLLGKKPGSASPAAMRAELCLLASMGEQSGAILSDQRRMIHSVLNLSQRTVAQVMRPLVDMVAAEKSTPIDTFMQLASKAGHTRIPVYEKHIFNIVGTVNLMDVIYAEDPGPTIEPFIRSDLRFVPESKPTDRLLKEILSTHSSMVFVVDEYGGVVGLVTTEDLIEEIVGDLSDERDDICHIRLVRPGVIECDGRAEIYILSETFGVPVPPGNYETIAGFVLGRTGTIPKSGDTVSLGDHFIITITEADAQGIERLCIRKTAEAGTGQHESGAWAE